MLRCRRVVLACVASLCLSGCLVGNAWAQLSVDNGSQVSGDGGAPPTPPPAATPAPPDGSQLSSNANDNYSSVDGTTTQKGASSSVSSLSLSLF